eukprot:3353926-Rhodomonas_salina.2
MRLCCKADDVSTLGLICVHDVGVDHFARLAPHAAVPLALLLSLAVGLVRIGHHTREQQHPGHNSSSNSSTNINTVAVVSVGDRRWCGIGEFCERALGCCDLDSQGRQRSVSGGFLHDGRHVVGGHSGRLRFERGELRL